MNKFLTKAFATAMIATGMALPALADDTAAPCMTDKGTAGYQLTVRKEASHVVGFLDVPNVGAYSSFFLKDVSPATPTEQHGILTATPPHGIYTSGGYGMEIAPGVEKLVIERHSGMSKEISETIICKIPAP